MATPSQTTQQPHASECGVQGEWLPKAEAAELLGVSTREIERKAASGRIQTKRVRLPGDRSDRTVYSGEDIERVKREREQGVMQLAPRTPLASSAMQEQTLAAVLKAALAPPTQPKPWMTLDEAAEYSGLTERQIRKLDRTQVLRGWGVAGNRRISKASIDAFSAQPL